MAAKPQAIGGAIGGAFGALPLLSVAREAARRIFSQPQLPGLLADAGDLKAATYLESFVLIVGIPLTAFFFGAILPGWLARGGGREPILPSAPGLAFALSLVLWRRGVPGGAALLIAAVIALLVAAATFHDRRRFVQRFDRSLETQESVLLCVGLWTIVCRSVGGSFVLGLLLLALCGGASMGYSRRRIRPRRQLA